MGFNIDVLRRRRDEMNDLGVKIQWVGRPNRLWKSVIQELEVAQALTKKNKVLTLNMCINYGGRSELIDAVNDIAALVSKKKLKAGSIRSEEHTSELQSH